MKKIAEQNVIQLDETPKPPRHTVLTKKKLLEKIMNGHGQGHGENYQSWLQIRRKNTSPISNQVVAWMPPLERTAHYLSRGEFQTAMFLLWLGVEDLREQYPLWPVAHPHPMEGALGAKGLKLNWSRGLQVISEEAGIDHGVEFGTRMPYVATIDLLATVLIDGELKLIAFSSKPIGDEDAEVKERTLERLELERRYFEEIAVSYFVTNSALVPSLVAGQLEWWIDCSNLSFAPKLIPHVDSFADFLNAHPDLSIAEVVAMAAEFLSINLDEGWLLFRHCSWHQKIDIDPSVPVLTTHPIRGGGRALRDQFRKKYFGVD